MHRAGWNWAGISVFRTTRDRCQISSRSVDIWGEWQPKNLFTTHNGGRPLPCGRGHQKITNYRIRSVVSVAYISSIFRLFGSLNLSFSGCDRSVYESVPVTGKRPPKRSRQSWLAVVQENSVFSVRRRSASGYHFEEFTRGAICFDWNCSILVR